jgi:hypothetical protein
MKLENYPTPLTDAAYKYNESEGGLCGPFPDGNWISSEFARDLERKLALCRSALKDSLVHFQTRILETEQEQQRYMTEIRQALALTA